MKKDGSINETKRDRYFYSKDIVVNLRIGGNNMHSVIYAYLGMRNVII
jgi:hypothetical protein